MKIAVAQISCGIGDVEANVRKISGFIEQAAKDGSEVVVFPEMADTGYDVSQISRYVSAWNPGPVNFIQKAAQKNRIYVICGLSELSERHIFNTLVVINPEGRLVAKYRKTHLAAFPPLNEDRIFTPGHSLETVRIGDFNCGLMICYDLRFPEVSRSLTLAGSEVLLLSAAWPFPRLRHWNTLIAARAIENQVFVVACNHAGSNSSVTFCGSSRIVDPFGVTVASASEEREMLIEGEILKPDLLSVRKAMPIFEHRHEELYQVSTCHKHFE